MHIMIILFIKHHLRNRSPLLRHKQRLQHVCNHIASDSEGPIVVHMAIKYSNFFGFSEVQLEKQKSDFQLKVQLIYAFIF